MRQDPRRHAPARPPKTRAALIRRPPFEHRLGVAFAVFALILIIWTAWEGYSLPGRATSEHYNLAWVGFDVVLTCALACTAWCRLRRPRYLPLAASAAGALLLVDAWFDVVSGGSGADTVLSVLLAGCVELPLAALCLWWGVHAQDVMATPPDAARRGPENGN